MPQISWLIDQSHQICPDDLLLYQTHIKGLEVAHVKRNVDLKDQNMVTMKTTDVFQVCNVCIKL